MSNNGCEVCLIEKKERIACDCKSLTTQRGLLEGFFSADIKNYGIFFIFLRNMGC